MEMWDSLLESLKGAKPTPKSTFLITESPFSVLASDTVTLGIRILAYGF